MTTQGERAYVAATESSDQALGDNADAQDTGAGATKRTAKTVSYTHLTLPTKA